MTPLRVAFDTGPLYGPRTGVGFAVEAMHAALAARDDVALRARLDDALPYTLAEAVHAVTREMAVDTV